MNISNRLARRIRDGEAAVGMWINLCDAGVAQLAAAAGYDWVMIDTEHNPLTEAQVQGLLHALQGSDVQSVVRVRGNREEHIKWVLDAGAGGIVIPGTRDAADARLAVEHCRYGPLGNRGYGPNRASAFFTREKEYVGNANADLVLICQVELASAVAEVDAICSTDGIDGIWIGPTDLAQSLGHLGAPQHPEVVSAIDTIIDAATRHGMPWGIPTGTAELFSAYVARGGTLMVLGSDTRILRVEGARFVEQARAVMRESSSSPEE